MLEKETDRKSTRLNSSHTVIYTLSLHDALPIYTAANLHLPSNLLSATRSLEIHKSKPLLRGPETKVHHSGIYKSCVCLNHQLTIYQKTSSRRNNQCWRRRQIGRAHV